MFIVFFIFNLNYKNEEKKILVEFYLLLSFLVIEVMVFKVFGIWDLFVVIILIFLI